MSTTKGGAQLAAETPTPRTDKEWDDNGVVAKFRGLSEAAVKRDFARQLERELKQAKKNYYDVADALCRESTGPEDLCRQARELREQLATERAAREASEAKAVAKRFEVIDSSATKLADLAHGLPEVSELRFRMVQEIGVIRNECALASVPAEKTDGNPPQVDATLEHELEKMADECNAVFSPDKRRNAIMSALRAVRDASLPLITNREKNQARKLLGEVLRHSDGPDHASHGCVEVSNAVAQVESLLAELAHARKSQPVNERLLGAAKALVGRITLWNKGVAEGVEVVALSNALFDAIRAAESAAPGLEAELAEMLRDVTERLDKGKGTWPQNDYVRDETWAHWQGEQMALRSLCYKLKLHPDELLNARKEGSQKP